MKICTATLWYSRCLTRQIGYQGMCDVQCELVVCLPHLRMGTTATVSAINSAGQRSTASVFTLMDLVVRSRVASYLRRQHRYRQSDRQTDRQTDRHQYFGTVSVLVISTAELGNKESILVVHVENARTRPSTPLPGKPYIFLLVYEYEYKLNLVMAPLGGKPRLLILECLR